MRVSLIICTYNRPDYLRDTVTQALAQDYDDVEIIVVDQTPRNPPQVEAFFANNTLPRLRYTRLARPHLPAARNHALAIATGDLLIFIDDDVQIAPDFVARHVEAHHRWAQTDSIGSTALPVGGISGANLSPRTPTWASVQARLVQYDGEQAVSWNEAWEVPWLTGSNMSFRGEVLRRAGGFDEHFTGGAWGEDVDISLSVRALGYRLMMEKELGLWHHQAEGGGGEHRLRDEEAREQERMAAWLYLIRKHWHTFGHREAWWRLWRHYRMYAGSLWLVRHKGWRVVWTRHWEFWAAWRDAVTWSVEF
jgi:GT2 family glycosyltransferase